MKILYSIIISITFIACTSYELIPEDEMQEIITQTLISEAVINRITPNMSSEQRKKYDSLDIYAPILDKYDYDIEDFQYTIRTFAMRKSNPLDNIFKNVATEIELYNSYATDRYKRLLYFDSLAMLHYVDTLYHKDTLITGKLAKYKIVLYKVPVGKYIVQFDYKTMANENLSSKSMRYIAGNRSKTKSQSTFWLDRNKDKEPFKAEFELNTTFDTLTISFTDFTIPKGLHILDSSTISNIKITQYPLLHKARSDYFYEKTGFVPSIKKEYEKRYPYLSDSITIPFERPRKVEPKRSN